MIRLGEEGDLDRLGDQGLLAHQDDVPGVEPGRGEDGERAAKASGPSSASRLAGEDDEHAGEAEQRGEDRARARSSP